MLQIFVRDTKVSFIAFQFFVGNRETLSHGLNLGKISIKGSCTVDIRSIQVYRILYSLSQK